MKVYITFLSFVFTCCSLVSQSTEFFIKEDHEDGPGFLNKQPAGAVDTLENGNFIYLIHQTSRETSNDNIVLYEIDPVNAIVVDSSIVEMPGNQYAAGVEKMAGGNIWVVATNHVLQADNFSELLLLEFDQNLQLLNTYSHNGFRYDYADAIVQSAAGSISVLSKSSNLKYNNNPLRLYTFATADGNLISDVALPGLKSKMQTSEQGKRSTDTFLTKGEDGQVMVVANSSGRFGRYAMVLTEEGLVTASNTLERPDIDCPSGFANQPFNINAYYDATKGVFVMVNYCMQAYELSVDGTVIVRQNFTGNMGDGIYQGAGYVQPTDTGFVAYFRRYRFEVVKDGNDYRTTSTSFLGSLWGASISGPIKNEKIILCDVSSTPRASIVYDLEQNRTSSISGMAHLYGESLGGKINTRLALGKGGIILGRRTGARKIDVAFSDEEGSFFSAPGVISEDIRAWDVGVGALPNGDFLVSRHTLYNRIDLIRVSCTEGISDTLHSEVLDNDRWGSRPSDIQGMDGNFYIRGRQWGNNTEKVIGVNPYGEVVFNLVNPNIRREDYDYPVPPAIDRMGNVYIVYHWGEDGHYVLRRYSSEGTILYGKELGSSDYVDATVLGIKANASGDRLVINVLAELPNGSYHNYFTEINAFNGEELRTVLITDTPAHSFKGSQLIYHSEGNDIICLTAVLRPLNGNGQYQEDLQLKVYNENGIFHDEVVYSDERAPTIYDMVINEQSEVFAAGRVYDSEAKKGIPIFLGLNYSNVITVEAPVNSDEVNFSVFPNPATDEVRLSWDNAERDSEYKLELFSSDGRLISRRTGVMACGHASLQMSMNKLQSGVYVARLTKDGEVSTKQIVKQ